MGVGVSGASDAFVGGSADMPESVPFEQAVRSISKARSSGISFFMVSSKKVFALLDVKIDIMSTVAYDNTILFVYCQTAKSVIE